MTTSSLDELTRLRSAFDTLASSTQAAASSADGGSNPLLPSLALLVAKAHGLSGNDDFVSKRDEAVAGMVSRGQAIDRAFPHAELAASWKPDPDLPDEYGAAMSQDVLREKATQARQTRQTIDAAKRRPFSGFDTVTSKTILIEAVQSNGRNAKSIRDALKYDVSQRYGRREWLFRWKQSDYDPGEQQLVGRQKRRDKYADRALEKSITLAVDTIKHSDQGLNIETATVALALAVASDKELLPAFRNHAEFRDLVGSVAKENQALSRLVDLANTWSGDREGAGPNGVHAISDPEVVHALRAERDTSGETDVAEKATRRGEREGTGREEDERSSDRKFPRIERDRHQAYGGRFDRQRSTLFSSHAFSTSLRQFTLLQVPLGGPVELLSDKKQSRAEMNRIREQIHRARIEAANMVEAPGSSGLERLESRLNSKLVVKITENTGYESRPEAERRSKTRQYVSGAGEVAKDTESRIIYMTPREIMSDRAPDIILQRVAATAGVEMPRQPDARSADTPETGGDGESNHTIKYEASVMTSETADSADEKHDRPPIKQETERDSAVDQVDSGAPADKHVLEPAPDGHPFEVGDQITLAEYSETLEMDDDRPLTVQSVNHTTGDTVVINDEGEDGAFNYKTDPSVKFSRVAPSREPETMSDARNGEAGRQMAGGGNTSLRRLNSRKSSIASLGREEDRGVSRA